MQCATVKVPLDYKDPSKGTIGIAIDRLRARGNATGDMLYNPGGPGASGLTELPQIAEQFSPTLRQHFNVIGFDPRGVGQSAPVNCGDSASIDAYLQVDQMPTDPAGLTAMTNSNSALIKQCQANSSRVLPYVGTQNAARDMDLIRKALGDDKLTYFGFSYGTLLGATYAEEFPTHIRAMVLDGAIDPAVPPLQEIDQQSIAFEGDINDFFNWCAANVAQCGWNPPGGRPAMQQAVLNLIHGAVTNPQRVGDRTVGPNQILYGLSYGMYATQSWPQTGQALQQASTGNPTLLLSFFDQYFDRSPNGTYDNELVAEQAINCDDQAWPPPDQIEANAAATAPQAPIIGPANILSGLFCTQWPYKGSDTPHRVNAPGSPPVLVVGSTNDPATPYQWAQSLAGQFPHGELLTRTGDGHTGYLSSSCIQTNVDPYLVSLTSPPPNTTCPSDQGGS